jgi:DNA-directed RNA polymerase specialized sigma24 family protein
VQAICPGPVAVETFVNASWSDSIRLHDHTVVVALLSKGVRLDDARDLAQESWTRLIAADQAGRLERIELPGLAIRQAMFLLSERRRVSKRRVEVPEDEAHELTGDAQPETLFESRQALAIVAAELSRATPRAREVMEASLSTAVPHAEHAAAIGLSVQRFRQVLCIVRARLRAAVEEATK